ncbi:transcription termination/antitermination protein NusA, partial [Candidatus Peregrinibacteria bacterium CG_4_10_14_0_2_um_filter_41_8]
MQSQFLAAISQLCAEKNLPRETVIETVEAALKAAYRKDFGNKNEELEVDMSNNVDSFTIYVVKEVAAEVEDPDLDMSIEEAKKHKKDPKVGDIIKIDVTPTGFGRIAAQAAKQVIIQRLQEAERDIMYDMFKDRENELLNAQVHRVQDDMVYIDLGKITVSLPKEHRIPGERYYAGQRLKLYLDKVIKTSKGPQLLISRTHPELVRKLMEMEIPEIQAGTVEIKRIAREPGVRTKLTVLSHDEKIDPIGACVGQKGVRIQSVMDELFGERIDVIYHTDDIEKLLRVSLAPATIVYIEINDAQRHAKVYVEEDQRPLAIGSKGQNVRLASKLTDLIVDIEDAKNLTDEQLEKSRSPKAQEMTTKKQKEKK